MDKVYELRVKYLKTIDYLIKNALENPGKYCGSDGVPLFSDEKPELFISIKYIGDKEID